MGGSEMGIQESNAGQRELSRAKFGSHVKEALPHSGFVPRRGRKRLEIWPRLEI